MAAGDLITADWEMELNGLLIGGDTVYSIVSVDGLLDLPAPIVSDVQRLYQEGQYGGIDYLGGRTITVQIEVFTETGFDDAITALVEATTPGASATGTATVFQFPGVGGGGKRQITSKVRRRATQINKDYYYEVPIFDVQLHAVDPHIYDNTANSDTTSLVATTAGLTFDATFDLSFGGVPTEGTMTATNDGTSHTHPVFTIDGPCDTPKVTNETTNEVLQFDIVLGNSDQLVVDEKNRTVVLNGQASRYYTLTSDSAWFTLATGTTQIRYTAATFSSSTITVDWRSSWL